MSGAPERAGLTSAALCPDGAAGGVVKARFKHFCFIGCGQTPRPRWPCAHRSCPRAAHGVKAGRDAPDMASISERPMSVSEKMCF